MRISSVTTETGSVIGVNYTLTNACSASAKPSAATNTSSCLWVPTTSSTSCDLGVFVDDATEAVTPLELELV
jgi:hypothetical protein